MPPPACVHSPLPIKSNYWGLKFLSFIQILFSCFFYVFQQFAIFYQEFAFQNSPGIIHPPLHPNLSKIDTSLSNKPETYVLFSKASSVICIHCLVPVLQEPFLEDKPYFGGRSSASRMKILRHWAIYIFAPFMENRFFSLIIYPDYTFLSIHSSQFFPTSSQIQIHPLFCLWLENK